MFLANAPIMIAGQALIYVEPIYNPSMLRLNPQRSALTAFAFLLNTIQVSPSQIYA